MILENSLYSKSSHLTFEHLTRIIGFYYFIEKIIICGLAVHTYSVCILIYFPSLSKKKKALYCMQQLAPFIINSFMYSLLPHKLAIWITCWGAIHKWCHPLRGEEGSAKRWRYSISLFSKMRDKAGREGSKISKNRWMAPRP